MLYRTLPLLFAALALAVLMCQTASAADTHEGKVVEAGKAKLTMTDKEGKNKQTHEVMRTAKITCDGKECKLEELKAGFPVAVTVEMTSVGTQVATKVEAKSKAK